MKILLAGCGKLCHRFLQILGNDNSYQFVAVKRHFEHNDELFKLANVKAVALDLCDEKALNDLDKDFDLIIFTATPSSFTENNYRSIYQKALTNLLDFQQANFPKNERNRWQPQLLMVSSSYVYTQDDGSWVNEDSPCVACDFRSEILIQAEKMVLARTQNLVIRLSGIYTNKSQYLINKLKQDKLALNPNYYTNRVHFEDVVNVLLFLLNKIKKQDKLDQIYLISDDTPATYQQVLTFLAKKHQLNSPQFNFPKNAKIGGKRCDNRRIKQLGFKFSYPDFQTGYNID